MEKVLIIRIAAWLFLAVGVFICVNMLRYVASLFGFVYLFAGFMLWFEFLAWSFREQRKDERRQQNKE